LTFSLRYSFTTPDDHPSSPSSSIPLLSPKKGSTLLTNVASQTNLNKTRTQFFLRDFQVTSRSELFEWLAVLSCCVADYQCDEEIRYALNKDPLQIGFRPLKLHSNIQSSFPQKSIFYVNYALRFAWTNLRNIENESPLLILLRFSNRYSQQSNQHKDSHGDSDGDNENDHCKRTDNDLPSPPSHRHLPPPLPLTQQSSFLEDHFVRNPVTSLDVIHVFCWLIENGCLLSHQNSLGNTVLHYAVLFRYTDLIRYFLLMEHVQRLNLSNLVTQLQRQHGEVDYWNVKNTEGLTPALLLEQQDRLEIDINFSDSLIRNYGYHLQRKTQLENYRLKLSALQTPPKKRFSYLKIFFEKQTLPSRYSPVPPSFLPSPLSFDCETGLHRLVQSC
jgi:hypothetical protein